MKAIVAVYHEENSDIWGIGKNGTQPLVLNADRKFFRKTTAGYPVIVGYKTLLDFPNSAPLPNRLNIVITRKNIEIPNAMVVHSIDEIDMKRYANAFVIGGASIYKQMLDMCEEVFVTHVYTNINPDAYFPNLDAQPDWEKELIEEEIENKVKYQIIKYSRKKVCQ